MADSTTLLTGVARECAATGDYRVVASSGTLSIDDRTCSVAGADGAPLLHLALQSVLFGASSTKLVIVPASRAPAWALRMASTSSAVHALRAAGCIVDFANQHAAAPPLPPLTDSALAAALAAPGFAELVQQMESALARRQAAGLPSLVA